MSVENDPGFWKWVAGGLVSAVGGLWGGWKYIDTELKKKADKHTVASQLQDVKNELAVQRGHIGKVFDQIRDNEGKSDERHRELLMHLIQRKE